MTIRYQQRLHLIQVGAVCKIWYVIQIINLRNMCNIYLRICNTHFVKGKGWRSSVWKEGGGHGGGWGRLGT